MLFLSLCCGGLNTQSRGCSSNVLLELQIILDSASSCTTSLTFLQLTETSWFDVAVACRIVASTRLQANIVLPADSLNQMYTHWVGTAVDEDSSFTCKVDVCHLTIGHESRSSTSSGSGGHAVISITFARTKGCTLNSRLPALRAIRSKVAVNHTCTVLNKSCTVRLGVTSSLQVLLCQTTLQEDKSSALFSAAASVIRGAPIALCSHMSKPDA